VITAGETIGFGRAQATIAALASIIASIVRNWIGSIIVFSWACRASVAPAPLAAPGGDLLVRFDTEVEVVRHLQGRLVDAGIRSAATAGVIVTDDALVPDYDWTHILVGPFLDRAAIARHLDAVVAAAFGPRASYFWREFPDRNAAIDAFREWNLIASGHELFHHARALQTLALDGWQWLDEERIAIDLEHALLVELVRVGDVPAAWLDRWAALPRALLAACDPEVSGAPIAEAETKVEFPSWRKDALADFAAVASGRPATRRDATQRWIITLARHRLALAKSTPQPRLADLAATRLTDPLLPQ
jgi:hypothetical protein